MTQAGYLPANPVADAKTLWYRRLGPTGFATRSESDLPPLLTLRFTGRDLADEVAVLAAAN